VPDLILPSKLIPERIIATWEFMDELDWGETIIGQQVVVEVAAGIDPNPEDILWLVASVIGSKVSQGFQLGLPGVIYRVTCTAESSAGKLYQKTSLLAVLPSAAIGPPLYGIPFTSRPYPIQDIEGIASSSLILEGDSLQLIIEGVNSSGFILAGELRDQLQSYSMLPEGIDSTGSILAGELRTILISYTGLPEGINSIGTIMAGELKTILITYTNGKPEGIDSTATILSGTLV